MNRHNSTDFDVITGPSMASACPVVDSAPATAEPPAPAEQPSEPAPSAAAEAAAA